MLDIARPMVHVAKYQLFQIKLPAVSYCYSFTFLSDQIFLTEIQMGFLLLYQATQCLTMAE